MIFPKLTLEPIVQENDLTRLNGTLSQLTNDEAEVTLVEIDPGDGSGFIDVTPTPATKASLYYLDWSYTTDGTKTVQLRITTDGAPVTSSLDLNVITEADDKLFSSDSDLTLHEPGILNWIVDGRNTFKDMHRRSQTLILDYLRREGWRNHDGSLITKDEILDLNEVREWSTFLTLKNIFEGRSNAIKDLFDLKATKYETMMIKARDSVFFAYDFNKDGSLSEAEKQINFNTIRVEKT